MSDSSNGTTNGWHSVSPDCPCPNCHKPDQCRLSSDGKRLCCYRPDFNGLTPDPKSEIEIAEGGRRYRTFWLTPRPPSNDLPEPKHSPRDSGGKKADPDTLHKVYSAILHQLPLEDRHTKNLQIRGLDMSQSRLRHETGYRTLPLSGRARALVRLIADGLERHLPGVPGCYVKEKDGRSFWTLAGSPGMLIPVRDAERRIVALLTRPDEKKAGKKYLWLSSAGKDRRGPGPGKPLPIHVPLFKGDRSTVRITEGALKADVATILSGTLTLGTPGLAWRGVVAVLRQLEAKTARVAYDADASTNPNVAHCIQGVAANLQAEGFVVELELWDIADGKGIDDLLAAGKTPTVLTGAAVDEAVAKIVTEAAACMPTAGTAKEADNDPHRLARLFLEAYQHDGFPTLYYQRETWLEWDGAAYQEVSLSEVRARLVARIKEEFDRLNILLLQRPTKEDEEPKNAQRVTGRLVSDVLQALASLALLPGASEPPCWLTTPEPAKPQDILAARNGLLVLSALVRGEASPLLPSTPAFFCRNAVGYDFQAEAPRPTRWLDFLGEAMPNDQDAIDALQEWFGYCLTPDTSQQKILLVVGPRRSGKGTISRVLKALIGPGNVCAPTLSSLATNFGLWPLLGKTLALISDARLGQRSGSSATIEERLLSISGEDPITVDRKHREPLTGQLPIRFAILTNELPRFEDSSGAMAGRLLLLPMHVSFFGREDVDLTNKLLAELPSILLWAIEGWRRLRVRGRFEQPQSGSQLLTELEELASPTMAFVRDFCLLEPSATVTSDLLFEAWSEWNDDQGVPQYQIPPKNIMGRNLLSTLRTIRVTQPRSTDGTRTKVYTGIKLRKLTKRQRDAMEAANHAPMPD